MEPPTSSPLLPERYPDPYGGRPAPPPFGAPLDPGQDPGSSRGNRPPRRDQSFLRRRLAPLGAALVAVLAKLKAILVLLANFKFLAAAGSMAVSVVAYSTFWGVWFALGFVVLLLVHELGHVIALRREGLQASLPMFIPFMGAVISARSLGDDAAAEARVGLAGPLLGTIGSAACLLIWHLTGGENYWRALAFTGFFLNLFNLLPVVPLDGGRAMAAMAPSMWFAGFAGMIAMAIAFPNPVMFIIVLLAARETYKRWQLRRSGGLAQQAYYRVSPRDRALVAAVYLGLVAVLVVGMSATHLPGSSF